MMRNSIDHVFVFLEVFAQEGGIQSYVKNIFQAYLTLPQSPRSEVFLLRDEAGCNNPYQGKSITFHYLKTSPPWKGRLKLALALTNCLLQRRPKVVICGHVKLAPLVRFLCQPLGIPYIVLTYGKEVWSPLPTFERQALQQASVIWTISRYSRENLCKANEINPKNVELFASGGVDGNQFIPGEKPPALLKKYGLAGSKVLLTVARLWSGDIYKGVDVTIRALPKILQTYPDIKYLVIGRGDDRPRLAQLAHDLGVGERVIFAGFVPTEELPDRYRVADAYIMPSQEGFGIVYLEAMACGIPVLSGDADGSADPLQDGRLGWRVPHRDVDAVAGACIEILQGNDRRCQGQWLREQTLARYGKEALKNRLKELLQQF